MRCNSRNVDPEVPDRSCGFLTTTEREYLLDKWSPGEEGEISDTQRSKKESDIQIRTRHALADFALIEEYADEKMKAGVIKHDEDPPLFDASAPEHISQGLFRFALDSAAGEEAGELLFDAVDSASMDERVAPLLSAALKGETEILIGEILDLLSDLIKDADLSDTQEKKIAIEANKHIQHLR